jgi:hypothetical protein
MPPLIAWLGQVFVPLRHLMPDVESALMVLIIGAAAATLVCIFRATRALATDAGVAPRVELLSSAAAVATCGGATLFIGLTHHFLTEPLQTFAAAFSMMAALHVERRSHRRNAAFVLLIIALAFLAKASSIVFVGPTLAYMGLAMFAVRREAKPAAAPRDTRWLAFGVVAFVSAVAWFGTNWRFMARHFIQATVGEEVRNSGAPAPVLSNMAYWSEALTHAVSLTRPLPVLLAGLMVAALAVAVLKLRGRHQVLRHALRSQTLYGFYLMGTVFAVVLAYAQQINRDPRYLELVLPFVACAAGWSLIVLRRSVVAAVVLVAALANAAANHGYSFVGPQRYGWLLVADRMTDERETLAAAIAATCTRDDATYPNAIGVSYAWLNANTANFFASKHRLEGGAKCAYYEIPQSDLPGVLAWADTMKIRSVITVAPDSQGPANFANVTSRVYADYLAGNAGFGLLPMSNERIKVYRRME